MIRLTTTAALITCMATPTIAQLTAPDVWNGFKAFNQATGLDLDATQTQTGNVTTISDLKFSGTFPYDLGSITITTTGFDLVENADGTVTINLPDHMPIALALTLPDDIFVTANLDYQSTGYNARASGDADNYTITYDIEKSVMRIVDMAIPGDSVFEIEMAMTFENMTGSTTYMPRDMLTISQHGSIGKVAMGGHYTIKGIGGDDDEMTSTISTQVQGIKSSSKAVLPAQGIDLLNLADQLRDGMAFQIISQIDSAATKEHVTVGGELFSEQKTFFQSSKSDMSVSKDGLMADGHYSNYALDLALKLAPFPIRVNFGRVGATIRLPLLKTDSVQDVRYVLSFEDLVMDEEIWAQFDPDGKLPRDPASLNIDLSGTAKLFVDLLDFDAMREVIKEGIKFGEPNTVTINNLDISAIGGNLTSRGAFTFDNSDLETFDGLPAPTGTATINIAGLNSILDQLVDIGLLESDAVFGMRMGLGLFTVVGEGEDTLVSEIEITPDGHVSANGKRLK